MTKAFNTAGETFALKRLRPLPADIDPAARRGREAALFEEYRNLIAVSHLQGFPQVLGYGVTRDGEPAILMEWVDGITLHDALEQHLLPPAPDGAGIDGLAVASLALSILRALVSTTYLEGTFAHRDISPRNIMLRRPGGKTTPDGAPTPNGMGAPDGAPTPVGTPIAWSTNTPLECCLIDLGSAIFMRRDEATFTMTMDVWRNATPEYAPPEMLALSDRGYLEARRSPAIDVYALCSVLYETYSGHTPFRLVDHPGESAYELKTAGLPPTPSLHEEHDAGLVGAIMSGLAQDQADRPNAGDLFDAIAAWRTSVTGQTTDHPGPGRHASARGAAHLTLASIPAGQSAAAQPQDYSAAVSASDRAFLPTTDRASGSSTPGSATSPAPSPEETPTRGRSISRRGLLVGAAAATAVVASGALWWRQTSPAGNARRFANQSWGDLADLAHRLSDAGTREEALSLAVEAGIAQKDGSMVDDLIHEVALADGTTASVQVVDFCHDDRADSQGKAGLTFSFVDPVAARPMAEQTMASGGWEQCDLRVWLDSDFRALLPSELVDVLTPVIKLTNNDGATREVSSVTTTEDIIWIPSMTELGGGRPASGFSTDYAYLADILGAEGTQYRLWQDKMVSSTTYNEALERSWEGKPCLWWNRSPSPDCSEDHGVTWVNRVGANGDVFHFACPATGDDDVTCVIPCFCL